MLRKAIKGLLLALIGGVLGWMFVIKPGAGLITAVMNTPGSLRILSELFDLTLGITLLAVILGVRVRIRIVR